MVQLQLLRNIIQKVNYAVSLEESLNILVAEVQQALQTEACTVYIIDKRKSQYVLVATEGLNPKMVKHIRFGLSDGLVGYVGFREEPINLEEASKHKHFLYHPDAGEEEYHAFLGVPIIHHKKVLGVLTVQQCNKRKFDESEEAFLVTVSAQIAGIFAHAESNGEMRELLASQHSKQKKQDVIFNGVASVHGIGIGNAVVVYPIADLDAVPNRDAQDINAELFAFDNALQATIGDIKLLEQRLSNSLAKEDLAIFQAYFSLLDSNSLGDEVREKIVEGNWAQGALRQVIKNYSYQFATMEDEYLKERAADISDLGRRILSHLQAIQPADIVYPENTILLGEELTPGDLAAVPSGQLKGIVTVKGSTNSHIAIIARSMKIPTIMGIQGVSFEKIKQASVVVDGYLGKIYVNPSEQLLNNFVKLVQEEDELEQSLAELRMEEAETPDQHRVKLYVNAGLSADAGLSLSVGANGIGLYRTEVPFMVREKFPSEEEQRIIYRQLLKTIFPRSVTMRTLDIGGDKALPYFPITEDNPFLGWRGIRVTLDHPEVFLIQVRALLKANYQLNNLKILLPMISCIEEINESKRLIEQAYNEIKEEGYQIEFPQIGAMIEVPSAVYIVKDIAKKVDFISVGTNDLIQYTLAVDRNNARINHLYQALHPAIIKSLISIVNDAHNAGIYASVCGEMAGDPLAVILLLAMGFDAFSMNAVSLPRIKWVIRSFSLAQARKILHEALSLDNANKVRLLLEKSIVDVGLGGLIRAGKN